MPDSAPPRAAFDYELLARQWLRALRGNRSQVALSRKLGYRTNVAYRWEAGVCFPTAARTFQVMQRVGIDVKASLHAFVPLTSEHHDGEELLTRDGVAHWLRGLHGGTPVLALSKRAGLSRFRVMRWLNGATEPTLPDLLRLVDATTGRLLDFIARFTDPEALPCARLAHRALVESRELAYRLPWSHAVLRALELDAYRALPRHDTNFVAARLGAPPEAVEEALAALTRVRQVQRGETHYEERAPDTVDTRANPDRALRLKSWWADLAVQRLTEGAPGLLSLSLSTVSRADLERLEQIQRRAYREMSRIIAESKPAECVVLHTAALLDLQQPGSTPDQDATSPKSAV